MMFSLLKFKSIFSGKSALHWAAAVNNIEAVENLLSHGANKDAQDNKEETPLFLAAREGSYEAAKRLLSRSANPEITDHMDRLPRDVAQERLHHDIVHLLDQHAARSPQMNSAMHFAGSPNMIHPPTIIGGSTKSSKKKRPKSQNTAVKEPISPGSETGGAKRKASVKKRKEAPPPPSKVQPTEASMSPVNSLESPHPGSFDSNLSPADPNMYNSHLMAMSCHNMTNLENVPMQIKQPPTYDECINGVTFCNNDMTYSDGGLDAQGVYMLPPPVSQQQHTVNHPRQNSMPVSLPNTNVNVNMPHYQSTNVMSPGKRPSLPTSPTHMAAMRAAQQQRNAQMSPLGQQQQQQQQGANQPLQNGFEYPQTDISQIYSSLKNTVVPHTQQQSYPNYQYHQYPTPPSQHSHISVPGETTPQQFVSPETYLTPSPESPGQWSSSSPHSASDWSEGISSPAAPTIPAQNMAHMDQMHAAPKQQDAIYI